MGTFQKLSLGLQMSYQELHFSDIDLERLKKNVMNHHFNCKLIMMLPDTNTIPKFIQECLAEDTSYYIIEQLNIIEFLDPNFIGSFVSNGSLCAYSIDERLDLDDCAAFLSSSTLSLSLKSSHYNKLNISQSSCVQFSKKTGNKYVINIDVTSLGNKDYQRILTALADYDLKFKFSLIWIPTDISICGSSIAKYFTEKGYVVREAKPRVRTFVRCGSSMPQMFPGENGSRKSDPSETLEWIGKQALNIDFEPNVEEVAGSAPTSCLLNVSHAEGFYLPCQIYHLVNKLREWLREKSDETMPWVALTVYGPPDCPISWAQSEHTFKTSGENFYTVLLSRDRLGLFTVEETKKQLKCQHKYSNK